MIHRLKHLAQGYPRQFFYLVIGMLISTMGVSMIWPFMTIYLRQRLGVPLSTVTALLTLDSAMSIFSSFVAGPIADRFGRKGVMVLSLGMMGITYAVMSQAVSLPFFAVLMGLRGAFIPLYRIGADAMIADLIPLEARADAYALLRMMNNVGFAIGPTVGGFITATSYATAFLIAASGMLFFSLFVGLTMVETLPSEARAARPLQEKAGGYNRILKDRFYLSFVGATTMTGMASSLVFVLLFVYVKENFGIVESRSGFIMAINALMVVFFQVMVVKKTRRFPPLHVLSIGALMYALGVGSIALGKGIPAFAVSMVIVTIGELMVVPTSTSLAASLAPIDMRGRYMSVYWLAWSISHGLGPVVGGLLNDNIAPQAIWVGGFVWGMLSLLVFWSLSRKAPSPAPVPKLQT